MSILVLFTVLISEILFENVYFFRYQTWFLKFSTSLKDERKGLLSFCFLHIYTLALPVEYLSCSRAEILR